MQEIRVAEAPWSERRATAIHEAGHTAMALLAGRTVEFVQMRGEEHGEMKCDLGEDPVLDIAIGLAGPAAERRYSGEYLDLPRSYRRSLEFWCTFHSDAVRKFALESANDDEEIANARLEQAEVRCSDYLRQPSVWTLIHAIADGLEMHGRLDQEQILAIAVRSAKDVVD
jgi:hypothetical protein